MTMNPYEHLAKTSFKPYLIHVEFEISNILGQIEYDTKLREILKEKGYDLNSFKIASDVFLSKIRQLIAVLQ